MMDLRQGDCLEIMPTLPSESVDMVLCDPPYGMTQCPWDSIVPLHEMWQQIYRITRKNRAQVLFGAQPFTTILIASNIEKFRHNWIWEKPSVTNALNAQKMPMRCCEDVLVFSEGRAQPDYYPQGLKKMNKIFRNAQSAIYGPKTEVYLQEKTGYPTHLIKFDYDKERVHPTQKPVKLLEYLIKTYTNPGDTVLDFTMGSGSTGVACKNTGRKFIGIEKDPEYFEIAKRRIAEMPHNMQVSDNILQPVLFEVT